MPPLLSQYLALGDSIDVGVDGLTVVDIGNYSAIRIVTVDDPTNSYLSGIKGGPYTVGMSRVAMVFNLTASAIHVAHYYDPQATVADPEDRFCMESGTFDIQPGQGKLLVHVGYWRILG